MAFLIWYLDRSSASVPAPQSRQEEDETSAVRRSKALEDSGRHVLHIQRSDGSFISRIELVQMWDEGAIGEDVQLAPAIASSASVSAGTPSARRAAATKGSQARTRFRFPPEAAE